MLVAHDDNSIGKVARAAFPSNRKPVKVEEFRGPKNLDSYWDGGSKDEYALVDLRTLRSVGLPENHPAFSGCGRLEIAELPRDFALVSGGYFLGKPAQVRVFLHPDNMVKFLPSPKPDLTERELTALGIICSIKGGEYRREEWRRRGLGDYSPNCAEICKLTEIGYVKVNSAGAVSATIDGRNAI